MMNDEFFADYLERLENLVSELRKAIQNLPPEAMDWVPGPQMNSMAVLMAHTTGSLRYWIGDVALGDPSGRVRQREFETHGLSGEALLHQLEAVLDYARSALPRLRLEDLKKTRLLESEDKPITYGWALLHALEHGSIHLGHIQLTSQLWRQK